MLQKKNDHSCIKESSENSAIYTYTYFVISIILILISCSPYFSLIHKATRDHYLAHFPGLLCELRMYENVKLSKYNRWLIIFSVRWTKS